jgi:hypothetical protein
MTKVGAPLAPTSAASHPWAKPALGGIGGGLVDLALSHTMPGATGMMLGAGAGEAFKLAQDAARGRAAPALLRGVQQTDPDAVRAAILAAQARPEQASMWQNTGSYLRNRALESSRVADRENQPRELTVHPRASGGHVLGPDVAAAHEHGWVWNGRGWTHRASRNAGGGFVPNSDSNFVGNFGRPPTLPAYRRASGGDVSSQAWEQEQAQIHQQQTQQTLKAALQRPLGTPTKAVRLLQTGLPDYLPPTGSDLMGWPTRTAENSYQRGGAVTGHQHLVDRLFAAHERAKREEKASTSGLLRQPDEAVAKALSIAQAAI